MNTKDIKVLIVDDSVTVASLLQRILKNFTIVGVADSAAEALRLERRHLPDVITMDIDLPDMDGLSLTKEILSRRKVPIIIITSLVSSNTQPLAFDCLQAGAYEILAKSKYLTAQGGRGERLTLLVKTAAARNREASPKTDRAEKKKRAFSSEKTGSSAVRPARHKKASLPPQLTAIGASTGGPQALKEILEGLPAEYPMPIAVAQHMSRGFIDGFVRWLDSQIPLRVSIAENGEALRPGLVYFPPSGMDLRVDKERRFVLSPTAGEWASPCIDNFFFSVADTMGCGAVYLLLTGMGSDGAKGMKRAWETGALTAIQDEATCVIYGMPKEAAVLCPEHPALPLGEISKWLLNLL